MMCDTNWCTFCDNAISPYSDSLYCSENCLRQDTLMCDSTTTVNSFTKHNTYGVKTVTAEVKSNSESCLPRLIRRKSSIPSLCYTHNNNNNSSSSSSSHGSGSNHMTATSNVFFTQCIPVSTMTPSLSSSISSSYSMAAPDVSNQMYEDHSTTPLYHPKTQNNSSYSILVERLNRAIVDL